MSVSCKSYDLINGKFRHILLVIVCPSGHVRVHDANSNIPVGWIKQKRLTAPFNWSIRRINKRLLGTSRGIICRRISVYLFVGVGFSGKIWERKGMGQT
ncbi:hypothetical protein Zmor_007430 [Zophobas morio]|uniref:Uncharacterized protein n=1 Tax=Zophobas morio TaxID=2755281 RepID=A0AA38IXC6_9CUCU|nr:hypothetical protein Zmor_007430 [Zophobas morio]